MSGRDGATAVGRATSLHGAAGCPSHGFVWAAGRSACSGARVVGLLVRPPWLGPFEYSDPEPLRRGNFGAGRQQQQQQQWRQPDLLTAPFVVLPLSGELSSVPLTSAKHSFGAATSGPLGLDFPQTSNSRNCRFELIAHLSRDCWQQLSAWGAALLCRRVAPGCIAAMPTAGLAGGLPSLRAIGDAEQLGGGHQARAAAQ